MRLIVHIPNPRWMRRMDAEIRDFTHHLESWAYDDYLEHRREPTTARMAWLMVQLAHARYWMPVLCLVMGHTWEDTDIGDAEVGPQPHVICTRCGRD